MFIVLVVSKLRRPLGRNLLSDGREAEQLALTIANGSLTGLTKLRWSFSQLGVCSRSP